MDKEINIVPVVGERNEAIPFALRFAERMECQGSLMATQYTTVDHTGPAPGHEDPHQDED